MHPLRRCAAAGAGLEPGADFVSFADPVALIAGRSDVLLAGARSTTSRATMRTRSSTRSTGTSPPDGLVFHAPRPDAWFVVSRHDAPPPATPLPAVRGAIEPSPAARRKARSSGGAGSRKCRCCCTRIRSMTRRALEGRALVTGIWVWGGGVLAATSESRPWRYTRRRAQQATLRAAWRRRPESRPAPPADFAKLPGKTDAIVVLPAAHRRLVARAARARMARAGAARARARNAGPVRTGGRRQRNRRDVDRTRALVAGALAGATCAARVRSAPRRGRSIMTIAIVRRPAGAATDALAAAGLPPVLARIYAARGIGAAGELDHSLAVLPSYRTLLGIEEAAARLARAIAHARAHPDRGRLRCRRRNRLRGGRARARARWAPTSTSWCPTASSSATG